MSWPDGAIVSGFELCTNVPMDEVEHISAELKAGKANPRDFKMKLAFELTRLNRGQEAAEAAQAHFINTIQKKEVPDDKDMAQHQIAKSKNLLVDILVETKLVKSKTEARQKIEEGAIKVKVEGRDEEMKAVKDVKAEVDLEDAPAAVIQKGKFTFIRIVRG